MANFAIHHLTATKIQSSSPNLLLINRSTTGIYDAPDPPQTESSCRMNQRWQQNPSRPHAKRNKPIVVGRKTYKLSLDYTRAVLSVTENVFGLSNHCVESNCFSVGKMQLLKPKIYFIYCKFSKLNSICFLLGSKWNQLIIDNFLIVI